MSYKQNVEEHLQHFAKSIGLGELSLNEHDACGLCFDDTLIVSMEYLADDEALVMVASVKMIDVHDTAKTDLFEKLLSINLEHHSMQGAFHALNQDQTEVLLIRSISAASDYAYFETTLEKFVNTLEWVISEVDNSDGPSSSNSQMNQSAPKLSEDPGDMGMMV